MDPSIGSHLHCNNTATALFIMMRDRSSCPVWEERGGQTSEAQRAITIEHLISSYEITCPLAATDILMIYRFQGSNDVVRVVYR